MHVYLVLIFFQPMKNKEGNKMELKIVFSLYITIPTSLVKYSCKLMAYNSVTFPYHILNFLFQCLYMHVTLFNYVKFSQTSFYLGLFLSLVICCLVICLSLIICVVICQLYVQLYVCISYMCSKYTDFVIKFQVIFNFLKKNTYRNLRYVLSNF